MKLGLGVKLLAAGLVWGVIPVVPALADHDGCWEGDCGGGQEYDGNWSNEDRNRNRGRNRGAFSPGPFDDSPVDAFNNVCMPGATCHYDGDGNQQEQPSNP